LLRAVLGRFRFGDFGGFLQRSIIKSRVLTAGAFADLDETYYSRVFFFDSCGVSSQENRPVSVGEIMCRISPLVSKDLLFKKPSQSFEETLPVILRKDP
jgi:hypothetical protein